MVEEGFDKGKRDGGKGCGWIPGTDFTVFTILKSILPP
jgi:hypothetical protein